MYGQCQLFLLTYIATAAIQITWAFNIDAKNPDIHDGEEKDFFGYKVLQFLSDTNKGIIVTAPLKKNGTGEICVQSKPNQCFSPTDADMSVKHVGLSMAVDDTRSQIAVCSPSLVHECNENSYLNSMCYIMTNQLQQISSFKPAFQECTKKTVDLVFLFDGSQSMTEQEFKKNKDFIVEIMGSLNGTSIKFAAAQFSFAPRTVFDFNDYQAGSAYKKLDNEPHMESLTNTHRALIFVLEKLFENPQAGASPDATKVLVLITDGDPSDSDRDRIVKRYDDKNIIRFVIGVKDAKMDKFRAIASEPKDKNAFKIENYDGLTGVLENFQKKIFKIEGSKTARAGDMTNEMSQSGFSAVFHKDTLILGSVGTNSWRGSLHEFHKEKPTEINDPLMEMDSYMGYSTSVVVKNKVPLYITGAPRFEHKGQVILFRHDGNTWTVVQRKSGDQIGSYFGAELCSADVNSDGNTDFLLVGAPLFYHPQEKKEGQIYIYTLTDEMELESTLNVSAPSMGRFGTTISSLADLNGDGLRDVAVGAPLEDDNRGAVYIFLGDKHTGIRHTYSQRVMGQEINSSLKFFGQSISGDIDLGEDRLPDIVVGSQGRAVVLRSRPTFDVTAHLSFTPKEISTDKIDCVGKADVNLLMVTLKVCFDMEEVTKSKPGAVTPQLNISYTLDVDPKRQTFRGFFSEADRKARNHTVAYELKDKSTCFDHPIYMPKCVKDTLSPISIKLNFDQNDAAGASNILNVDSKLQAAVEIPFEKQCRKNDTCIAELEVDFDFMTPTLLVAEDNYFNVTLKLTNHGDDSYNTSLTMHYPPGLSFSRMTLIEATRPTLHSCHDLEGVLDKMICGVSLPVYRSRSAATFKASFHVMSNYNWNDTMSMTITGNSDNANSTGRNSVTKSIAVQFEIKMAVTVSEDSITYLNFTTEDQPKTIVSIFKIDNPGLKAYPVNVSVFFPTKLEHMFEMQNYQVSLEKNKSTNVANMMSDYCSPEKYCKVIVCESFILDKESATEIRLSGDVQFKDLKKHPANTDFLKRYTGGGAVVKFKSFIKVSYDMQRYVLDSHKQKESAGTGLWKDDPTLKQADTRIEFTVNPNKQQIIFTGAGLGFLLLLIITIIMLKLGCFKRKTVEDYQLKEEKAALKAASMTNLSCSPAGATVSQAKSDGKSDKPAEEELLVCGGEANGGQKPGDCEFEEILVS